MSDISNLIGKLEFIRDYECKTKPEVEAMNETITKLSAEPEQHGRWIQDESGDYKCSECGSREDQFIYGREIWYGNGESNYCPNCGSYNGGEANEID